MSAALNLGGISNMTVVADGAVRSAYDIGPANALLDAVVADDPDLSVGYDDDGRIAATGAVDEALLAVLLDDPYYALPAPKSTGKEHFHLDYVRAALERVGRSPATPDLLATLTELTVRHGRARRAGGGLSTASLPRAAGAATRISSAGSPPRSRA